MPISKSTQNTLVKMRYSKTGAIGIGERGGRQLMQILPVKEFADFKNHQDLVVNWADECIRQLDNGATITDVKACLGAPMTQNFTSPALWASILGPGPKFGAGTSDLRPSVEI